MNLTKVFEKAIKFILLLIALLGEQSGHAQQWTLSSCVNQAINNHPDIKSAQLDLGISMAGVDQAKSNFYPEVGVSVFQSGNFGRSIDRFTNAYIDQFYNTTYDGIRLNMPLLDCAGNLIRKLNPKCLSQ